MHVARACTSGQLLLAMELIPSSQSPCRRDVDNSLNLSPYPGTLPLSSGSQSRAHPRDPASRRSSLPWPSLSPHQAAMSRCFAELRSISKPTNSIPDALHHRHHCVLHRLCLSAAVVDLRCPELPRPCLPARLNRREPLHISPCLLAHVLALAAVLTNPTSGRRQGHRRPHFQ